MPLNNLLIRACRIYLENDFILAGLKANFTYKVTMAFLNCVEISNQNKLFNILPKLCKDLANKFMDTLAEFGVKWTHVKMGKLLPQSDLNQLILGEMCKQASMGVELQCKHEYWGEDSEA